MLKKKWVQFVGESVNVKKKKKNEEEEEENNLIITIFFYLNLSKMLHFLFFKTKRERKCK